MVTLLLMRDTVCGETVTSHQNLLNKRDIFTVEGRAVLSNVLAKADDMQ